MSSYDENQWQKTREENLSPYLVMEGKLTELGKGVPSQGVDQNQEEAELLAIIVENQDT